MSAPGKVVNWVSGNVSNHKLGVRQSHLRHFHWGPYSWLASLWEESGNPSLEGHVEIQGSIIFPGYWIQVAHQNKELGTDPHLPYIQSMCPVGLEIQTVLLTGCKWAGFRQFESGGVRGWLPSVAQSLFQVELTHSCWGPPLYGVPQWMEVGGRIAWQLWLAKNYFFAIFLRCLLHLS